MKETGLKINKKVMVLRVGQMGQFLRVIYSKYITQDIINKGRKRV